MNKKETAIAYFQKSDAGDMSVIELFTEDAQIYFPKFGIGHGKEGFGELAFGLSNYVNQLAHRIDEFQIFEDGDHVIVEGTTFGEGTDQKSWSGGETPGGRFCSIFRFQDSEYGPKIARMHIYLDADYTSDHENGFHWGKDRPQW